MIMESLRYCGKKVEELTVAIISATSGRSTRNPTSIEVEDLEPLLIVTGVESGWSQMANFELAKILKKNSKKRSLEKTMPKSLR